MLLRANVWLTVVIYVGLADSFLWHYQYLLMLSPGSTREIGSALTRLCLRHRSIDSKLKTFTRYVFVVISFMYPQICAKLCVALMLMNTCCVDWEQNWILLLWTALLYCKFHGHNSLALSWKWISLHCTKYGWMWILEWCPSLLQCDHGHYGHTTSGTNWRVEENCCYSWPRTCTRYVTNDCRVLLNCGWFTCRILSDYFRSHVIKYHLRSWILLTVNE